MWDHRTAAEPGPERARRRPIPNSKPATVAAYLVALPAHRRQRFGALRDAVLAAASGAEESISYDMPTYRVGGRLLCSIGSFARHDSLFPASGLVRERLGDEVAPYVEGKGTIRFGLDEPLPLELVRRIVMIRLDEVADRGP